MPGDHFLVEAERNLAEQPELADAGRRHERLDVDRHLPARRTRSLVRHRDASSHALTVSLDEGDGSHQARPRYGAEYLVDEVGPSRHGSASP